MEITIPRQENSSIEKEITITLGDYTILAGENNSGKTNLINAIRESDTLKEYKEIHIPADDINPEDTTKTSNSTSKFYKILDSIIKPIFNQEVLSDLVDEFDGSDKKKDFVASINTKLEELGVDKKEFDIEIDKETFKEKAIINIAKAIAKDLYQTEIEAVDFKDIGMGTRRLIVVALLQYYQEEEIGSDDKILLIFEEPEVYLHPSWKKSLHETLMELSKREGTIVLITTHDPYFIELGRDQKIYKVYRDNDNDDTTAIEDVENKGSLPYKSDSEINYIVFDIPSKTYFLELYQYACSFFEGEDYKKLNVWIIEQNTESKIEVEFVDGDPDNPKVSNLRHKLGHPREATMDITEDEIMKRIRELRKLIPVIEQEEEKNTE